MQNKKSRPALAYYADGIIKGDRVVLAQAITLIESELSSDREIASNLVQTMQPHSGNALRVGITGAPGVGKSSLIESLGKHITDQHNKIAVLTIDPSSPRTKGSILGDKTRMDTLARNPHAFIRPSPAGKALGGVTNRTREAMMLCEAAGFNVIIVETVGVGQSEVAVKNMVDFFLLLLLPGAGDELQGIKKGIVELSDALVITKADGDNLDRARQAQAEYQHALHLLNPGGSTWRTPVMLISSLTGSGIQEIWHTMTEFKNKTTASGEFDTNRINQRLIWFEEQFHFLLQRNLTESETLQQQIKSLKEKVISQMLSPSLAAHQLLQLFYQSICK
ncbi:MAG TPA: methylmalonyl Co-A mutase-associated GTPase MeaB [Ohtaekwangia sp.]|nr:methylmalonyl Co-A mutase-associated GTPase MeaB [Ohtaekwangia sp.]